MYCPSCGKDVNPDLRFCNNCGARIGGSNEPDPNALSETSFHVLIGALLTIPIVGIGLILGLMVVMKQQLGFSDGVVMTAVFLSFLLLIAAEGGFIWLMLTRTKRRKSFSEKDQRNLESAAIGEKVLTEGQPRGFPDPVSSVTDHTTRTLDKVPRGSQED